MQKNHKGFAHPFALVLVVAVLALIGFAAYRVTKVSHQKTVQNSSTDTPENKQQADQQAVLSTDPVTKGKYLSNSQCEGSGSKQLTSVPMKPADIGVIQPMGNMVPGGHVTPIDHEYYYQKNPSAPADTYDVLAPADGNIVSIQYRTQNVGDQNRNGQSDSVNQYRIVISYSCTFFSYYDLMTSLDKSVTDKQPSAKQGQLQGVIAVKAGQVIGHVGGESLDFAVWDTTKTAKGLLFPAAYTGEAWKINTVAPLDYFSDSVKKQILPYYVRSSAPQDGRFDYDIAGKAVGNWFKVGTNGYSGSTDGQPSPTYYRGHLALAYDSIDSSAVVFSIGDFNGDAKLFAIKGNGPDPATIGVSSSPTTYELIQLNHMTSTGQEWNGNSNEKVTVSKNGPVAGVALIQLTDTNNMKVEVFPGKTASQVSGFDSNAQTYDRGQDSKISR